MTLGFDAEGADFLSPDLWTRVLTPREGEWLLALPPSQRPRKARLAFSAKESFYKAQFPLTHRFLEFQDVEVSVDEASDTFEVRVVRGAAVDRPLRHCRGHYADAPDMVLTGIALHASDLAGTS